MASQAETQSSLLNEVIDSITEYKSLVEEHFDENEPSELACVAHIVKHLCMVEFHSNKNSRAAQAVMDYFNDDHDNHHIDVEDLFDRTLKEDEMQFDEDLEHNPTWCRIMRNNEDSAVEVVKQKSKGPKKETVYEEMNDSIFCSNAFTPPIDPISKTVVECPFKNRICGHVYEKKFIQQYIKSMKNKAKCPYIGCNNKNLTMQQLVRDEGMERKIREYLETQASTSQDRSSDSE